MAYIRQICLFHHLFFGQKDYVWYIAKNIYFQPSDHIFYVSLYLCIFSEVS